jgi:hypothetical protein
MLLYIITLVELTGQRSNEFEGDLSSAIKHLDVIDKTKEHSQLF